MARVIALAGAVILGAPAILGACGGASTTSTSRPTRPSPRGAPPQRPSRLPAVAPSDWPQFGYDAQHSGAGSTVTGITAANVARLRRRRVQLPGTADSSAIYLHGVEVHGALHDVFVVTTSYGQTVAIDAAAARVLWTFVPPGLAGWAGSDRITNAAPASDPDRRHVYAASPDGHIHKLSLSDGREIRGRSWPTSATHDARHEKLSSAISVWGANVIVTTAGYLGDAPPYQGHVVVLARASGRVRAVFNSLCSHLHRLLVPPRCPASGAAIWARAGAVVEPNSGRLLVATGNGPYDGDTRLGDSVLELNPHLDGLRQAYTPTDQAQLEARDADLGSTAPALLPGALAVQGGKDGILRLLDLRHLDGETNKRQLGGELQRLPTPSGQQLLSAPAVWRHGAQTSVFAADDGATAAYALHGHRLSRLWRSPRAGTSPVLAGGLLWVYDPAGGLVVYRPSSPHTLARLPAGSGHWNSPVVADGRVALPEGDANEHLAHGVLDIYSLAP